MRSSHLSRLAALSALAALAATAAWAAPADRDAALTDIALSAFGTVADDRGIRLGSIGSGLYPAEKGNELWMVTDRGPNGQPGDKRTFPVPDFNPTIVRVKVKGDRVELKERIPITTKAGGPVSGLPNLSAVTSPVSATPPAPDEVPYNFDASAPLGTYNQNGLDTEDIVRDGDGNFWVVDEYRPSVVKIAKSGKVLARYVPEGVKEELDAAGYPVHETLPATHAYRRANRGYEGLAISPDGKSIFVALQSPLQLPPSTTVGRDSRITRILRLDTKGQVKDEVVYRFDEAAAFDPGSGARARDMKVSGLYALSKNKVLVLERTDFVAKVYVADLSGATDLESWASPGGDPNYLETLNADGALEGAGVTPVSKTLLIDLESIDGMPDKIESIALVDKDTLAVANDNDFGLTDNPTWSASGGLTSDTGVPSRILYVKVPHVG